MKFALISATCLERISNQPFVVQEEELVNANVILFKAMLKYFCLIFNVI